MSATLVGGVERAYWEQGSLTHYTDEALDLRRALRAHPDVLSQLNAWWKAALALAGKDATSLGKEQYIHVLKLIGKLMILKWVDKEVPSPLSPGRHISG